MSSENLTIYLSMVYYNESRDVLSNILLSLFLGWVQALLFSSPPLFVLEPSFISITAAGRTASSGSSCVQLRPGGVPEIPRNAMRDLAGFQTSAFGTFPM